MGPEMHWAISWFHIKDYHFVWSSFPDRRTTKCTILRNVTPCNPVQINRRFEGTYATIFRIEKPTRNHQEVRNKQSSASCLVYCSTLKTETVRWFEMLVNFYRTPRRHNTDDRILHNHRYENFKFNTETTLSDNRKITELFYIIFTDIVSIQRMKILSEM
jgi:hypothetical protein